MKNKINWLKECEQFLESYNLEIKQVAGSGLDFKSLYIGKKNANNCKFTVTKQHI